MFVDERELELQTYNHGRINPFAYIWISLCMLRIDDVASIVSYIAARKNVRLFLGSTSEWFPKR